MTLTKTLIGAGVATILMIAPAAASDCKSDDPFTCLSQHVDSELDRLSLKPNTDQAKSFDALDSFATFKKGGAEAAVKQWETDELPVYDLILALLLAGQEDDARTVALAATEPFAFDADGKSLKGKEGFAQMRQDLRSFYHGEENMVYSRACVSDEAFELEIGGSPEMRLGACRAPYDKRSVQRAFGMMQLMRDVSRDAAVEATMQYAYRVPACIVAQAIIEIAPSSKALGENDETAAWKVLDMATICAAELLSGTDL